MRHLPFLGAVILGAPDAFAAVADDIAAGQKAAQHQCSNCHDTTGKVPPAHPPGGAPAFIEIAQSPDITAEKLRQFLRFPHGRMVTLLLTGREADNAIKYILSLREK